MKEPKSRMQDKSDMFYGYRVLILSGLVLSSCAAFEQSESSSTVTPVYSYPVSAEKTVFGPEWDMNIYTLDWQPDDERIALASDLFTYLYTVNDDSVQELKNNGTLDWVLWSPGGATLAGSERRLWVWDPTTDELRFNTENWSTYTHFTIVCWGPDRKRIIANYETMTDEPSSIQAWNISTGETVPYVAQDLPSALARGCSSDGTLLVLDSPEDNRIYIVDFESGDIVHVMEDSDASLPLEWSSDNGLLASSSPNNNIVIWDTATWHPLIELTGNRSHVHEIRWRPGGGYLATTSDEEIRIWNTQSGAYSIVPTEPSNALDWNSDGTKLATSIQNKLFIWSIDSLP